MNSKGAGKKAVNPFQAFLAPGTMVPNNPENGRGLMQAIDAVEGPDGAKILRQTYYKDSMAAMPDAPAFQTVPTQSTIGFEAPTPKGIGDMPGTPLPVGHPGGGALGRLDAKQLGMSTSPSMAGSGPQRNVPPPKRA